MLAVRFPVPKMRSFVDGLHSRGQKWVPIQDAGIAVAKGYRAYEEGVRDDVFIKDHAGQTYVGQVRAPPGAQQAALRVANAGVGGALTTCRAVIMCCACHRCGQAQLSTQTTWRRPRWRAG